MSDELSPPPDARPTATAVPTDTLLEAAAPAASSALWPGPLRYGVGIVLVAIVVASLLLILPLIQIILLSFLIAFIMFLPSRALAHRTRLPLAAAASKKPRPDDYLDHMQSR